MVLSQWIKVTHAKQTETCQKCVSCDGSHLSGGEGCRGSSKEHIRTKQVTDKERSTNIRVTDV